MTKPRKVQFKFDERSQWTVEELKARGIDVLAPNKRHKFGAKRAIVDGIRFDSTREGERYAELNILQKAGEISNLELQPQFHMVIGGVKVCTYIADFRYLENGVEVVEDVKSTSTKTRLYQLKKKLLKALHGIEIREV